MENGRIGFRLGNALITRGARLIDIKWRLRLRRYRRDQVALARQYGVDAATPESYGPSTVARVQAAARRFRGAVAYALTSGSTGEAKRLLYPSGRTRRLRLLYVGQVMLAYAHLRLARPIFYVLADSRPGSSLTGLLARDRRRGLVERWIYPQSFFRVQEIFPLTGRYSQDALNLALLALVNPTMIVTVNPSSLFVLLDRAHREWQAVRDEVGAILNEESVKGILRRSGAPGERRREELMAIINAPAPPRAAAFLPALRAVHCWEGGYVGPFIHNLRAQLSGLDVIFYPMFSLSTETIATLLLPSLSTGGGFPLGPEVCYEFIPAADGNAAPDAILKPWDLSIGREYEMVISDPYGLRRYRTEDIFVCLGKAGDAPLLRFVRRAGLAYSFTGEKITGKQLERLYSRLRRDLVAPHLVFTCFPRLNAGGLPGYVVVCSTPGASGGEAIPTPEAVDGALREINAEYERKRLSGRLAAVDVRVESYPALVERILRSFGPAAQASAGQFKLLPLYSVFWETVEAAQMPVVAATAF